MKAALLIVLSLSALAMAGPAFNTNNQIADKQQQQQQSYMTQFSGEYKKTQATDLLEKWCFASQMSQSELTSSFKKLVQIVKANPTEQATEQAVMSGMICQGALVQKNEKSGETVAKTETDAQAHELIKDVYMDALIACENRECMQQLLRIIESEQVDPIRASYYMTRVAIGSDISSKSNGIKDEEQVKQLAMSFIKNAGRQQQMNEIVERQQLLAVTGTLDKVIKGKQIDEQNTGKSQDEMVEIAKEVAKVIVERYIKPVSQQEVRKYQEQPAQEQNEQLIKKIAKRSAALKALANLPAFILKQQPQLEQIILEIVENKDELSTVRQSAIECLENNDKQIKLLKQITFSQDEPTEVRVAAYRALMTAFTTGTTTTGQETTTEQQQIIEQLIKHCEQPANQQQDEQFVLYVISHLNNVRTSQQPEVAAIKECLEQNKQQLMKVQILCQKFKQQLEQIRKYSRNYKMEQQFNQIESGLVLEGDLVYESESKKQSGDLEILPKLVRVNVSMPVMGETVNVIELTLRQQNMDEQLLETLKLVQSAKFSGPESMSKVVESFKDAAQKQQQQQQQQQNKQNKQQDQQQQQPAEADLCIKVDGQTIVYVSLDDIKCQHQHQQHKHQQGEQFNLSANKRQTRSAFYRDQPQSMIEAVVEHLKRQPISFNRGLNFNLNQRFAKLLDIEASLIGGLRFESRAQRHGQDEFELLVRAEPRLAFESIVGPAKMSAKKLLNRASTKCALGLRLRYKQDELVDFELELPMEKMELFNVEQQLVKSTKSGEFAYLEESVYGEQNIYSADDMFQQNSNKYNTQRQHYQPSIMKRSVFGGDNDRQSTLKTLSQVFRGNKRQFEHTYETPEEITRATGLRSLVRVVVSPKELGYRVQWAVQKVDPRMTSIRVQVSSKTEQRSQGEHKQYQLIVSTPGSRTDRTTQIRVQQQLTSQRSLIKAAVESPMMSASATYELIHDGRQYAAKVELSGQREKHTAEIGFQRGQQSASGRIAATYKPYLQVQSTQLKHPIQMQAIVSCQWEPKTVISYELKSMSQSSNFVQGKIILDSTRKQQQQQQQFTTKRRSMDSAIERMLTQDVTLVAELAAQIESHLVKVHHMTQWEPSKLSLQSDFTMQHKNSRKSSQDKTVTGLLKIDEDKQIAQLECKYPQAPRKDFRVQLVEERKNGQHQLVAEIRYKQNLSEIVAYKHKLQAVSAKPTKWNKFDLVTEMELVASEWSVHEKLAGRTHVIWEREQKQVECELKSNDNKQVKIAIDSNKQLGQHKFELFAKVDRVGQHQTAVRLTQGTIAVQSRTDCLRRNVMLQKTEIEISKPSSRQQQVGQCRVNVEMPTKQVKVAFDAKLNQSGKPSSWDIETPAFVSRGEFSFETLARQGRNFMSLPSVLRFKSEARNQHSKDAYWLDSHFDRSQQSYVRAHSPVYAAEMTFEPDFQNAKLGMFARSKRSISQFEDIYSTKDFQQTSSPLDITNKLWAMRSVLSHVPTEQKKRIVSMLFEFLNRESQHNHMLEWNPTEQRASLSMQAKNLREDESRPAMSARLDAFSRFDRPSKLDIDSAAWGKYEFEAKPFDGETAFAKLSAHSRHPRSAFKKHESEIRYEREHGLRGQLKHEDRDAKMHQISLESDRQPQKWAKIEMDSEKHGKAKWEHKWRHEKTKRHSLNKRSIMTTTGDDFEQDDDVWANQMSAEYESPRNDWTQRTQVHWQEPHRFNKNANKYSVFDYIKNVNGRVQSQYHKQQKPIYELDFDFKPDQMQKEQQSSIARLNMRLADQWDHNTHFDFIPQENTFKLSSRAHSDSPARDQIYDFSAQTRSPRFFGLATEQQEPMFFNDEHESLDKNAKQSAIFNTLFKQPLKLYYTDKFGRAARFDYDHSPVDSVASKQQSKFAGLRQKRAVAYFKDADNEIEHESSLNFYPELMLAKYQQQQQQQQHYFNKNQQQRTMFQADKPGQMTLKTHTKYGPVVAQIDSDESACELKLVSPIVSAKLTAETAGSNKRVGGAKLYKFELDNTNQKVSVEKFIRKLPGVGQCQIAREAAKRFDQARFEHQSELLVSIIDKIIKLKSETRNEKRPVLTVEAELNKQQEKLVVKVDGKRCCDGQLVVDLAAKTAEFAIKSNESHQYNHQTRIAKLNNRFYSIESITTLRQKPIFKLSSKIAADIMENPSHFFAAKSGRFARDQHVSEFEAVFYEPKPVLVQGKLQCENKQLSLVFSNNKHVSHVDLQLDDQNDRLMVQGKLIAGQQNSKPYQFSKIINIAPFTAVY